MQAVEFDWDPHKASDSLRKHGVSFEEATSVFGDIFGVTAADPDHSRDESRLVTVGVSNRNRLLLVSPAERDGRLRLISARELTRKERNAYETTRHESA